MDDSKLVKTEIYVKCNYRGEELVKCDDCGYEYPISYRECPECGSTKSSFLREEREAIANDKD